MFYEVIRLGQPFYSQYSLHLRLIILFTVSRSLILETLTWFIAILWSENTHTTTF